MNAYLSILLGVILSVLGAFGIWELRSDVLTVLKGVVGIVVLMIGIIFLMMGLSDIREGKEEEE